MKEEKLPIQVTICSACTFTATFLSPQLFGCQCAPSLTDRLGWVDRLRPVYSR